MSPLVTCKLCRCITSTFTSLVPPLTLPHSSSRVSLIPASTLMLTTLKFESKQDQSSSSGHTAAAISRSHKDSSRHSPAISLPPLDLLQQQRRGSVTDPSLHAASAGSSAFRQLDGTDAYPICCSPNDISLSIGPRPAPNYVFGDSSLSNTNSEPSSKQMRKILRSPSPERDLGHYPNGKGAISAHTSSHANGISSACSSDLSVRSVNHPTP